MVMKATVTNSDDLAKLPDKTVFIDADGTWYRIYKFTPFTKPVLLEFGTELDAALWAVSMPVTVVIVK